MKSPAPDELPRGAMTRGGKREAVDLSGIEGQLQPKLEGGLVASFPGTGAAARPRRTGRRRGCSAARRSRDSGRSRTGSPSGVSRSPRLLTALRARRRRVFPETPGRARSRPARPAATPAPPPRRRELLRRQELAGIVEDKLHGLKSERHRNRALERDARFRAAARIHVQVAADGLLNDRHVHLHRGAAFALAVTTIFWSSAPRSRHRPRRRAASPASRTECAG